MPEADRQNEVLALSSTATVGEPTSIPPLSPRLVVVRAALIVVAVVTTCLLLYILFVSGLQGRAKQQRSFDRFRSALAEGTAPIGPAVDGRELAPGTGVAFLEIPSIGVSQVVGEGSRGVDLMGGPGHRRDTPLPGQVGTSVILGRQGTFGGPFSRLGDLKVGAKIKVTTGQGESEFIVTGLRSGGDPAPPPLKKGSGRLLLVTASGRRFMSSGVLRVDADLVTPALPAVARSVTAKSLPASEQAMGTDPSTIWALAMWLQALTLLAVGAVWSWHRWGPAQAWVVFLPPVALVGIFVAGQGARLLPNLV